jgi:hypothetical protein
MKQTLYLQKKALANDSVYAKKRRKSNQLESTRHKAYSKQKTCGADETVAD